MTLALDDNMQVDKVDKTVDGITYQEHQVMCRQQAVVGLTADLLLEAVEMLDGVNSQRGPTRYRYLLQYESRKRGPAAPARRPLLHKILISVPGGVSQ